MRRISALFVILSFGVIGASSAAAREWLDNRELTALFSGDLSFSLNIMSQKTHTLIEMAFTYKDDATWEVMHPTGKTAWGEWRIEGMKYCRDMTGHSDDWKGLRIPSVCAGIKFRDGKLFVGKREYEMVLDDLVVLTRIEGDSAAPKMAMAGRRRGQDPLAQERRELEQQRLALERERLESEAELQKMRVALERRRIEQETLALQANRRMQATPAEPARTAARLIPDIEFGSYHALVIGINNYKNLPKLNMAKGDAKAVAAELRTHYGFKVTELIDPTREDILDAFDELRETLSEDDNLLVYYAGHGWLDQEAGRGYWLPVNARTDRRSRWFSNADLTDALRAILAKHVMVVADSCYSGTLTRSIKVPNRNPTYLRRMAEKRTRVVLTSGGLEPVQDAGGGKHSVFAAQFLKALRGNEAVIDGTQLFNEVRQNVVLNADQTPEYSDIRKAGHEGGDFLFVRRN